MDEFELYLSGLSILEVSEKTDIAKSTLRFRFFKKGIIRPRTEAIRMAAKKGKLSHMKGKKRVFNEEWLDNIKKSAIKRWEGKAKGYSLKPNGYYEITTGDNKGRSVHVVVMEEYIGRKVYKNEVVHHKNEIKTDNDISNLELMTKSEHARHHAKINLINRTRNALGRFE